MYVDQATKRWSPLGLARTAVRWELAIWRSLYRWVTRRPKTAGASDVAFGYAAALIPIIWAFIILSAIEIPVFHLLIPWETVRIIGLALGVWGLTWMVGLLASMKVYPHVVGERGLQVRNGAMLDFTIPWQDIESVGNRLRSLESGRAVQFEGDVSALVLMVTVSNQTNIDVVLRRPVSVRLPKGTTEPITELRIFADEPAALVAQARQHLSAALESH